MATSRGVVHPGRSAIGTLSGLLPLLRNLPEYARALAALRDGRHPLVVGPARAEKAYLLAALAEDLTLARGHVLVICPSQDAADRLHDDLLTFRSDLEGRVVFFPQPDLLRPEEPPSPQVAGERLAVMLRLGQGDPAWVLAPVGALLRPVPSAAELRASARILAAGQRTDRDALVEYLHASGYMRVELVESKGQFAVRGGIVDLFPPHLDRPVRAEWLGDDIESLRVFDPSTQRSTGTVAEVVVPPADDRPGTATLLDYLPGGSLLVYDEPDELRRQCRALREHAGDGGLLDWDALESGGQTLRRLSLSTLHPSFRADMEVTLPCAGVETFAGQMRLLSRRLQEWQAAGRRIVVVTTQSHRIREILSDHGVPGVAPAGPGEVPAPGQVAVADGPLSGGFQMDPLDLVVVTDSEIVGWRRRRRRMRFREGVRLYSWTDLSPGDLVVHVHHGIGIYRGMVRLLMGGAERDYLELEYAQGDRLYVPTDQIDLVQRYIGVEGQQPRIHRLGGAEWEREKKRVREAARELARELLQLYALRETAQGHAFGPDTPWQQELEATFEFEETPDQWLAIQDVKRDMESPRPMDRLIAGDVGYGKTEVALRAAFKAVMDGRQVAVLVPTTVLAQQHYTVFLKRLAPYPVTVEVLSRFRSRAEQRKVLEGLAAGTVDIVIGTHRLLQPDVRFRNLGLVIIDEEQRFGVRHKEHLKKLRATVDVLALTATPIPRTLHMSLVGLRDMSVMETPPEARLPIHTEVRPYDDALVRAAILRELDRGGQVYVVHNRVETIERAARRIRALVPEARVAVAHGQMPEDRLEQVMLDFLGGRFDVLVCTTIVEIGLDIPRVNTILIEDAHLMGLSQLYQLRGRVGRSDRQAYCYLLYPRGAALTEEARQRLEAMREFVELGSGFKLALRDLEIRGAGNLLGPEQHGHLAAVGFELYTRLLDEAVRELRGQAVEEAPAPTIDLGLDAYLPQDYIPDEGQRMAMYRKMAAARTPEEADGVADEIVDRYGPPPPPAAALLDLLRLRELARDAGMASITREHDRILIRPAAGWTLSPEEEARLVGRFRGRLTVSGPVLRLQAPGPAQAADVEAVRQVLDALRGLTRRREPAGVAASGPGG
ncbi:MAG: transcription-repair coupling factor [Armatimonadota bacterium]|nr:transcription-repair coupling factor [Armatimonadota bacterium]